MATSTRAGSNRLPHKGLASRVRQASSGEMRRLLASVGKLAVVLSFAAPGLAQQHFTGGPFVIPADGNGLNTIARQTVAVTVSTASAIRSISIPLGFRGSPEFEFISQSGCIVDGSTMNAAGTVCSVVLRFAPRGPGLRTGQLRIIDGSGAVTNLGITGTGFYPQAAVFPALASIIAGVPTAGYTGDGDSALVASFSAPGGVVADSFGNIYVADTNNNAVRMIDAFGNVTTIASENTKGYSDGGSTNLAPGVKKPTFLAIDSAQNLYIADTGEQVIRRIPLGTGGAMTTVAGTGLVAGFAGDGGLATSAQLSSPQGIALDAVGNLYIVDSGNGRIRKVDAVSGNISTIAGTGSAAFTPSTVPAATAGFNQPTGIAIDAAGNLYIADTGNSAVRELAGGNVVLYAGTGTAGKTGNGGPAISATLSQPLGLALDAAGNLYIADSLNNMVRRVDRSMGTIDLYLGESKGGYKSGLLPSNQTEINGPFGLAFDSGQNLIVVDSGNNVIRSVNASAGGVQFSATAVGQKTAEQPISLFNIGTAPLSLAAPALAFADATSSSNFNLLTTSSPACTGTIAAGGHCTVTATYSPQNSGFTPGEIDATDDSLTPAIKTAVQPIYLLGGPVPSIVITPVSLPTVVANVAYTSTVTATGGYGGLAVEEAGDLPAGITAAISGTAITFSGTATVVGDYPITVFATDKMGNIVSQALTLSVQPQSLTITITESVHVVDTPTELAGLVLTIAEAVHVTDTNNNLLGLMLTVAEAVHVLDTPVELPGLGLNITEAVHVSDDVTMHLALALSPASGALPGGMLLSNYAGAVVTASGGSGTYSFSTSGSIPPGLIFAASGASYTLSGTPQTAGTYIFNVTVNDGQATPVTNSYSVVIQQAQQTISVGKIATPMYGDGGFAVPVSSDSGLPVTLSVVSGPVSGNGPYTITGAGNVNFHATQAGNTNYAATSLDFTVTIQPAVLTLTANNATRVFDAPNPVLTYQVSGFVLRDSASVLRGTALATTSAVGTSAPGSYPINVSTGTLSVANYSFNFVPGTLTVTGGATQTIQFGKIPQLPVGTVMLLTAHASSGLVVSYAVSGPATLSGQRLTVTGPGTVTVTASQAGNGSYAAAPNVVRSFTAQ